MKPDELNDYIKHYIVQDKTQLALMLTGPWGTGKSYYINHTLIPYLNDYEKQCILVSLYGLKSINEISKSIFLECRLKFANKTSEAKNTCKIIAKTILKGVASFFGVNLDVDEKDLEKLYSSIDLSNKLIILEDVERSQIDVLELLGFVNNLVEQDSVKVLLVTNEDELLHYEKVINNKDDAKKLDEKSLKYLKVKEKTVGDTIKFYSPTKSTISSIINNFNDNQLKKLNCEPVLDEIEDIMNKTKCSNLRSFIFGCQKTLDLFNNVNFKIDDNFYKKVFYSNIAFGLRRKNNEELKWDSKGDTSSTLGTYKYPLYKFSYEYICFQYLDKEAIKDSQLKFQQHESRALANKAIKENLNVIYSYYISKESDIIKSINFLLNRLETTNDIPFEEYGRLGNYLIAIKYDLNCDDLVEKCKTKMLLNIKHISNVDSNDIFYNNGIELESEESKIEFGKFKNDLSKEIKNCNGNDIDFDYKRSSIDSFVDYIYKNKNSFIEKREFARKINNEKFTKLLGECDAKEIDDLRNAYCSIYSSLNVKYYFYDDLNSILDLIEKLSKELLENKSFDKIQVKQIKYFISNLKEIELKLK